MEQGKWLGKMTFGVLILVLSPFFLILQTSCGKSSPSAPTLQATPSLVTTWTPANPIGGIAISGTSLYVADRQNNLIKKYDLSGNPDGSWTSPTFTTGLALAVNSAGTTIYAGSDTSNGITAFNALATPVATWSNGDTTRSLAVDSSGNVYATCYSLGTVHKYDSAGVSLTSWASGTHPYGIAVHGSTVYVGDQNDQKVRTYDLSGNPGSTTWTSNNTATSIAVDSQGRIYVGGEDLGTVQRFSPTGK